MDRSVSTRAHDVQEDPVPCEPPWTGWIETTGDALLILEAARRGLIPRVTRRLVDSERKMITSGSVFVFDEDESGIKRWTDGFFWSPSRILGNFLLYRETDKKTHLRGGQRSNSSLLVNEGGSSIQRVESSTLSRPKSSDAASEMDRARERSLFGSLTNSKKFKSQGMMKKTFSLSIGGVAQHLISYYRVEDVEQGRLRTPSSLPELAALEISPEYLDKTHFRVPPRVEHDSDGVPRYRGEADEPESPSMTLSELPASPPSPVLPKKRSQRRYDPYGDLPVKRKKSRASPTETTAVEGSSGHPSTAAPVPYEPAPYYPYGVPAPTCVYPLAPAGFYSSSPSAIPYNGFPSPNSADSPGNSPTAYSTTPAFYPSAVPSVYAPGAPAGHHAPVGIMYSYPQAVMWRHTGADKDDVGGQQSPESDAHEHAGHGMGNIAPIE